MAEGQKSFQYVAVDAGGRRTKGMVAAWDDHAAFERLKRDGLSPITIRLADPGKDAASRETLGEKDLAALLGDLAALLRAGADMRTAFTILAARSTPSTRTIARAISDDVAGGEAIELAFSKRIPARFNFVGALIGAGDASSDISAGFERASDLLRARIKLREHFISIVSYPLFVLASTIIALSIIIFFVVPSLAPLVDGPQTKAPPILAVMIGVSTFATANFWTLALLLVAGCAAIWGVMRLGLLRGPLEALLLDGPVRRTVQGIVYGGFSVALGSMLAGGAPVGDSLRLAVRTVGMTRARARLEPVIAAVRQGQSLSAALDGVPGFPASVRRLATVGEASGSVGATIVRAGKFEEDEALQRLESAGRLLGPALIVILGGAIGLLMAGLLSGITQLGDTALQ